MRKSKVQFEDSNLTRCEKCGRLIPKKEGHNLCSHCIEEEKKGKKHISVEEYTPPQTEEQILSNENEVQISQPQEANVEEKLRFRICSMCKERPSLPNRELCLKCMTEMYRGFKTAKEEILSEGKKVPSTETISWVRETYDVAQRMEPYRRLRTQGMTWIKRYNLH